MGIFDSLFGWGGEDPLAVRQREEGYRRQEAERIRQQQEADAAAQQAQLDYMEKIRQDDLAREAEAKAKDPTETRAAAARTVGQQFGPEFESTWVGGGVTDPYETEAYNREFGNAQDYLDRLLKRGVITDTGRAAAFKDLESQAPRVRTQLNDIGNTILEAERAKLGGFRDRALGAASSLGVGEGFDVNPYYSGAQTELGTFTGGLGDLYRSQVPKDLFDTSGLGNIAGAAQFAGNRPFDPDLSGTPTTTDENDPYATTPKKRTATVF